MILYNIKFIDINSICSLREEDYAKVGKFPEILTDNNQPSVLWRISPVFPLTKARRDGKPD